MIDLTKLGLISIAISVQLSASTTLSSSEPVKLEATTTCTDGTYEWRIDEKAGDGVFSDQKVFWFPPNPSWTPGTYHIIVKETCPGQEPKTESVEATIIPDPCPELATLFAGSDETITEVTNVKLKAVHDECRPNADVSYKWTISEYSANGVYSDQDVYWFPSNRIDFTPGNTYHITVKAIDNVDPTNTTTDSVNVTIQADE